MSDFKHAEVPIVSKRKRKRMTAKSKGLGEKVQHRPPGFIVGCPLCEWITVEGTRRPVEQRIASSTRHVICKAGHKFDVTKG